MKGTSYKIKKIEKIGLFIQKKVETCRNWKFVLRLQRNVKDREKREINLLFLRKTQ